MDEISLIWGGTQGMDTLLQEKGGSSVSDDTGEPAPKGLRLPVQAGTRVRFKQNLNNLFYYTQMPPADTGGTVVRVRTAGGDVTVGDGRVMILWDNGQMRPAYPQHLVRLRGRTASLSVRQVHASMGDLSEVFGFSRTGSELIHRATEDLWAFREENGSVILERLFQEDGTPLKV